MLKAAKIGHIVQGHGVNFQFKIGDLAMSINALLGFCKF